MDGCWMDGMPGPIDDTTPTPSICFCEAARCRIRSSPCRLPRELSSACLPACLSIRFPPREVTTARLAARRAGRRAFVHTYRLGGPVGVVVVAWSSGLHAGLHAHVAVFCSSPDKSAH